MVHCRYDGVERDMPWVTPNWANFAVGPKEAFWTPGGPERASARRYARVSWCDADPDLHQQPLIRCRCHDGTDPTRLCTPVAARSVDRTFCLNQCHGRGECAAGYCRCPSGWLGADCSIRADAAGTGGHESSRGSAGIGATGARRAGGAEELASYAPQPSESREGGPRPRIFVYELPGEFNTFLLARRQSNDACAIREYSQRMNRGAAGVSNDPPIASWTPTLYGSEVALHEALLASPHRELDPAKADFFYVPAYGGCYISEFNRPYPAHWLCDRCHKGASADLALVRAMRWHERLLEHISSTYPFWNASGGADHLWPFTHDEGACYAPAALSRATLLVHWGRMHTFPNGSSEYHLWRVKPVASRMYGWTRCYDPCKDLVLPSWRKPEAILASPYVQEQQQALAKGAKWSDEPRAPSGASAARGGRAMKRHLFYFNGVIGYKPTGGGDLANYSFGLRQQLYVLYGNGRHSADVVVTDVKTPSYGAELAASTFCGVLPGWGWSGRMEDAVLHGCIPVILQDGVHTPWESVLDASAFSLRVPRAQMARLVEILRAIPAERVASMQAALAATWPRFSYLSVAANEARRRGLPLPAVAEAAAERDAVATLLQVLRARLALRSARAAAASSAHPLPSPLRPQEGCVPDPRGGDISPAPGDDVKRPGFEGRLVNGWII